VHHIFPITAVQYELSVLAPRSREEVLPWCRKHGVGFLAFAPVGRGFLSGKVDSAAIGPDDSRSRDPRFGAEAVRVNHEIVAGLWAIGERHAATAAQVAIAWTLAQGDNIVPIPGTRRRFWLEENLAAVDLQLTAEDLRDIAALPTPMGEMSWDNTRNTESATDPSTKDGAAVK
jgi:aryl-alcohol dehydrogenase-like predicted oxidoreductase